MRGDQLVASTSNKMALWATAGSRKNQKKLKIPLDTDTV